MINTITGIKETVITLQELIYANEAIGDPYFDKTWLCITDSPLETGLLKNEFVISE